MTIKYSNKRFVRSAVKLPSGRYKVEGELGQGFSILPMLAKWV